MRGLACAAALATLSSCAADSEPRLLNSERIEARYGDYAVDVRFQSDSARISELYSNGAGERRTRTIAVVEFAAHDAPELDRVDAAIRAGASLGASLKEAGWLVIKESLSVGSLTAPDDLYTRLGAALCHTGRGPIAVYRYRLRASKGAADYLYATITEFYDPDYLTVSALSRLTAIPATPVAENLDAPRAALADITLHRETASTPCD
ncbi:MAG: hypothetical protein AAGC71_15885 [Pseudomonadota bacterium]